MGRRGDLRTNSWASSGTTTDTVISVMAVLFAGVWDPHIETEPQSNGFSIAVDLVVSFMLALVLVIILSRPILEPLIRPRWSRPDSFIVRILILNHHQQHPLRSEDPKELLRIRTSKRGEMRQLSTSRSLNTWGIVIAGRNSDVVVVRNGTEPGWWAGSRWRQLRRRRNGAADAVNIGVVEWEGGGSLLLLRLVVVSGVFALKLLELRQVLEAGSAWRRFREGFAGLQYQCVLIIFYIAMWLLGRVSRRTVGHARGSDDAWMSCLWAAWQRLCRIDAQNSQRRRRRRI